MWKTLCRMPSWSCTVTATQQLSFCLQPLLSSNYVFLAMSLHLIDPVLWSSVLAMDRRLGGRHVRTPEQASQLHPFERIRGNHTSEASAWFISSHTSPHRQYNNLVPRHGNAIEELILAPSGDLFSKVIPSRFSHVQGNLFRSELHLEGSMVTQQQWYRHENGGRLV